jgi:hypothetical protein
VKCQLSDNTPPTMWLERYWKILESEPVGSKIIQAHGRDNEGGRVIYGLEPLQSLGSETPTEKLPFWIDPNTGIVYLNESLEGRVTPPRLSPSPSNPHFAGRPKHSPLRDGFRRRPDRKIRSLRRHPQGAEPAVDAVVSGQQEEFTGASRISRAAQFQPAAAARPQESAPFDQQQSAAEAALPAEVQIERFDSLASYQNRRR